MPLHNPFRKQDNSDTTMLENWVDAGVKFFTLRHRKRVKFEISVFGFDQILRINSVRDGGMKAQWGQKPTVFKPDSRDVLHAYIPDTPRNRQKLAQTFYTGDYTITGYFSQESGNLGESEAQAMIRALAAKLGVNPGTKRLETQASVRVRGRGAAPEAKPAAASPEPIPGKPIAKMTAAEIRALAQEQVYGQWAPMVEKLKKKHGPAGWQKSKEYRDFIQPDIGVAVKELERLAQAGAGLPDPEAPEAPAEEPESEGGVIV